MNRTVLFSAAASILLLAGCGTSLPQGRLARFYRLPASERKLFLGLRARDSTAAAAYLNLATAGERLDYYTKYWQDRETEKKDFERRCEYAVREFSRSDPLSDDRIGVYIVYGYPTSRISYAGKNMILLPGSEIVKPAEVWTYENEGCEFDFLQIKKGYTMISRSEFGRRAAVPCLQEDTAASGPAPDSAGALDFDMAYGRFRQSKSLTRFEIYLSCGLTGARDRVFYRTVRIFDAATDKLVAAKSEYLRPVNADRGTFYDEANFLLEPKKYRVRLDLTDVRDGRTGRRETVVDLLDYAGDVKEISDLVTAVLIDTALTERKFDKPIGRVIPSATAVFPVRTPFYFYHEAYNLSTPNGLFELNTTYEIYHKVSLKQEIVDILIQDVSGTDSTAYLAAKYHPFNLAPGTYIVVAKDTDKLSGKVRTAIGEFTLVGK